MKVFVHYRVEIGVELQGWRRCKANHGRVPWGLFMRIKRLTVNSAMLIQQRKLIWAGKLIVFKYAFHASFKSSASKKRIGTKQDPLSNCSVSSVRWKDVCSSRLSNTAGNRLTKGDEVPWGSLSFVRKSVPGKSVWSTDTAVENQLNQILQRNLKAHTRKRRLAHTP